MLRDSVVTYLDYSIHIASEMNNRGKTTTHLAPVRIDGRKETQNVQFEFRW